MIKVEISKCVASQWQPRTAKENEKFRQIKETMRHGGQDEPVHGFWRNGMFHIFGGSTRFGAAKELGWESIDAIESPPKGKYDELRSALSSNVHGELHLLSVDMNGEATGGKAWAIWHMFCENPNVLSIVRDTGETEDNVSAYIYLCEEATAAIRQKVARGEMALSALKRYRDAPVEAQRQIEALPDDVTTEKAGRIAKEVRKGQRAEVVKKQKALFDMPKSAYTTTLKQIEMAMGQVEAGKLSLCSADLDTVHRIVEKAGAIILALGEK